MFSWERRPRDLIPRDKGSPEFREFERRHLRVFGILRCLGFDISSTLVGRRLRSRDKFGVLEKFSSSSPDRCRHVGTTQVLTYL